MQTILAKNVQNENASFELDNQIKSLDSKSSNKWTNNLNQSSRTNRDFESSNVAQMIVDVNSNNFKTAQNNSGNRMERSKSSDINENTTRKTRVKHKKRTKSSITDLSEAQEIRHNGSVKSNAFDKLQKQYVIEYPIKKIRHASERSLTLQLLKNCAFFITNLILILPILAYVLILVPIKYFFHLMFKICHFCHLTGTSPHAPDSIPKYLSPIEKFWLFNSQLGENETSTNKSIGACILFVEGYLSKTTIRDLIHNKIIDFSNRAGQKLFSRFTQRLYNVFAYGYVWLNCSEFNIEDHIIEIEENLETNEELQNYVNGLLEKKVFNMEKPLWFIYYKKSFGADKLTVLIFVFHMCFADGVSLIRMLFKGLVDNRNAIDLKPRFAYFNFDYDFIKQHIFGWSKLVYFLIFKRRDKNPLHNTLFKSNVFRNLNKPLSDKCMKSEHSNIKKLKSTLTWSEPFDLVLLNRMKAVTRSKMNDFLISLTAGMLHEYLKLIGINQPQNMHCIMPINLSSNNYPFELKNDSTIAFLKIPVNTEGCLPRLWNTKRLNKSFKSSSDYLFVHFLISTMFNLLPSSLAFRLIKNFLNKSSFVVSTLGAGDESLSTLSLCNRNLRNIIYVYPNVCDVAISFSIITYGDEVRLSLVTNNDIIPQPNLIVKEFKKQLETLNELLANRRIPGEIKRSYRPHIESLKSNPANIYYEDDEPSIDEMQQKMSEIQQELQKLSDLLQSLDPKLIDYNKQKQIVVIKTQRLKKEFAEVLLKLQIRSNTHNQAIPSDDEDELDPIERGRLRSSSVASKASLGSYGYKNRDSSTAESEKQSRKESEGVYSRKGSVSYSSGIFYQGDHASSNHYKESSFHNASDNSPNINSNQSIKGSNPEKHRQDHNKLIILNEISNQEHQLDENINNLSKL